MDVTAKVDIGLNEMVDKLAEKVGVASDHVGPVLGKAVEQYQVGAFAMTLFGVVLILSGFLVGWLLIKRAGKISTLVAEMKVQDEDRQKIANRDGERILCGVMGVLVIVGGLLFGLIVSGTYLFRAFAPIPYLFKWLV